RGALFAAQPGDDVPPAHRGARDGGRGAEAVLRPPEDARGRGAEDHGEAAGAAEGARCGGEIGAADDPGAAARDREFPQARHRDAQGTEGTAQEPAPGRRGARLLDQGGEYRPDSLPRGFAWARRFLPEAPQAAAFGMNARIVGVLVVLLIALGGGALLVREQQSAPRSA